MPGADGAQVPAIGGQDLPHPQAFGHRDDRGIDERVEWPRVGENGHW